jgi:integrase
MPGTRRTTDRNKKERPKGSPELLLELIIEEFIFDTQQKTSDGSTPRAYRQPMRLFVRFITEELGRTPWLSDFTLAAVQRWATTLQERPKWERGGLAVGTKPLAVETRRTYLRTLRTFSNWLPRPPHTYCAEPPLKHLILPRASQTYKLPLTDDEVTRLILAAKEDTLFGARDTAMLLFLMDSATRAMELCRLRIGDVTLQTGLVLVASRPSGVRACAFCSRKTGPTGVVTGSTCGPSGSYTLAGPPLRTIPAGRREASSAAGTSCGTISE